MLKVYKVSFDADITLKPCDEPENKDGYNNLCEQIGDIICDGLNITHDGVVDSITVNNISFLISVVLKEEGDSDNLVTTRAIIEHRIVKLLEDGLNITYGGSVSDIKLKNVHYRAGTENEYKKFKDNNK